VEPFGSVDAIAAKAAGVIVIVTTAHIGRYRRHRQPAESVVQNIEGRAGSRPGFIAMSARGPDTLVLASGPSLPFASLRIGWL
jgi:hypothetical protein